MQSIKENQRRREGGGGAGGESLAVQESAGGSNFRSTCCEATHNCDAQHDTAAVGRIF